MAVNWPPIAESTVDAHCAAVEAAEQYIRDHMAEKIVLDDLCQAAGYSRFHLTRVFGWVVGTSPQRHVAKMRVARARQLLETTDWPITTIANDVGLSNQTLPAQFRREYAMSPIQFRRNMPRLTQEVPPCLNEDIVAQPRSGAHLDGGGQREQ